MYKVIVLFICVLLVFTNISTIHVQGNERISGTIQLESEASTGGNTSNPPDDDSVGDEVYMVDILSNNPLDNQTNGKLNVFFSTTLNIDYDHNQFNGAINKVAVNTFQSGVFTAPTSDLRPWKHAYMIGTKIMTTISIKKEAATEAKYLAPSPSFANLTFHNNEVIGSKFENTKTNYIVGVDATETEVVGADGVSRNTYTYKHIVNDSHVGTFQTRNIETSGGIKSFEQETIFDVNTRVGGWRIGTSETCEMKVNRFDINPEFSCKEEL